MGIGKTVKMVVNIHKNEPMSCNMSGNLLSEMIIHNLLMLLKNNNYTMPILIDNKNTYPYYDFSSGLPDKVVGTNDALSSTLYQTTIFPYTPKKLVAYQTLISKSKIGKLRFLYPDDLYWKGYVEYTAGEKIILKSGFQVTDGAYFRAKIEQQDFCKVREGIYDIFNVPYNSAYLALNNTGDSITPQLKSFKTDTVYSYKANNIEKIISILPNPTSGIITISYNQNMPFIVEVTNTLGENVYYSEFSTGSVIIDLTKQPKGLYFIKVYDANYLLKVAQIIYQ